MIEPKLVDTETFLKNHCTLSSLPEVVSKVEREINQEEGNINKINELINGEPALTSQILKVVNSAYYGLSSEIRNVRMAIEFMGLNEIYRMVLAFSVINTLNVDQKKELNNFWYHSFYSAICTRYLAKKFEPLMPLEDLWSASILHDIGKLVYLKFFPDH
jgi:HD-like signal output (HDOD) protein